MNELTLKLEKSILTPLDPNAKGIIKNALENGIDSIIDNEVIKKIPILSSIIAIVNTSKNIYNNNLLKQTAEFINTWNERNISTEKLEKYQEKMKNPKYAEKELGRVLLLLNSTIDLEKSKILAKIFASYVNEEIDWDKFCELSDLNSRIYIADINLFNKISSLGTSNSSEYENYQIERLIGLGLLDSANKSFRLGSNSPTPIDKIIAPSSLGRLYAMFIQ